MSRRRRVNINYKALYQRFTFSIYTAEGCRWGALESLLSEKVLQKEKHTVYQYTTVKTPFASLRAGRALTRCHLSVLKIAFFLRNLRFLSHTKAYVLRLLTRGSCTRVLRRTRETSTRRSLRHTLCQAPDSAAVRLDRRVLRYNCAALVLWGVIYRSSDHHQPPTRKELEREQHSLDINHHHSE